MTAGEASLGLLAIGLGAVASPVLAKAAGPPSACAGRRPRSYFSPRRPLHFGCS